MKELTVKKYIADDGSEFDNQEDCINYECQSLDALCENIKRMQHVLINQRFITDIDVSSMDYILAVRAESYSDVKKIEDWFNYQREYEEPMDLEDIRSYIGHILFFHCEVEDCARDSAPTVNDARPLAFFGTAEDYLYSMTRSFNKLVDLVHEAERK